MSSFDEETLQRVTHEVNAWMSVEAMIQLKRKLIEEHGDLGYSFRIELTDGRVAGLVCYEPILQHRELNYGITFDPEEWDLLGVAVRFTQEGPVATRNEYGFYDQDILFEDDALDFDYDDEDAFITQTRGFPPMYRKVFNIEVENTHTYYVGELGAWVHTSEREVSVSNIAELILSQKN